MAASLWAVARGRAVAAAAVCGTSGSTVSSAGTQGCVAFG
jgi:hypothetical protein